MCKIILKSIHKCRSYVQDKVNLNISPKTVTLTLGISKQTFGLTLVLVKKNKCVKLF